jgi:hypothetical protein
MKTRGVGYMDAVEALFPYRNETNIFLQISKKISYLKILINLRTYITYNENTIYQDISVIFMLDMGLRNALGSKTCSGFLPLPPFLRIWEENWLLSVR